jgi:hypothetical protein
MTLCSISGCHQEDSIGRPSGKHLGSPTHGQDCTFIALQHAGNIYIPLTVYPRREGEASQIFLRDAHVLSKLAMINTADVTGGKPIAV